MSCDCQDCELLALEHSFSALKICSYVCQKMSENTLKKQIFLFVLQETNFLSCVQCGYHSTRKSEFNPIQGERERIRSFLKLLSCFFLLVRPKIQRKVIFFHFFLGGGGVFPIFLSLDSPLFLENRIYTIQFFHFLPTNCSKNGEMRLEFCIYAIQS